MRNQLIKILNERVLRLTTLVAVIQFVSIFLIKDKLQYELILSTTSSWLFWTNK
jgi:hypothetical protein